MIHMDDLVIELILLTMIIVPVIKTRLRPVSANQRNRPQILRRFRRSV